MQAGDALIKKRPSRKLGFFSRSTPDLASSLGAALRCVALELGVPFSWDELGHGTEDGASLPLERILAHAAAATPDVASYRVSELRGEWRCERRQWQYEPLLPVMEQGRDLHRSVILISGGGGGLGALVAQPLARQGARVIACGRSEQPRTRLEPGVIYRSADCTDRSAVTDLVRWIEGTYGPITGLIHAAGMTKDKYFSA